MKRLGGSDIAKLLGVSKYGNEGNVYERVMGLDDDPWNPMMERGAMFEPVLRAHGQNFLQLDIEEVASDYHEHPTLEFAHAQVDDLARLRGAPVCVDYKTQSRWAKGWGKDGSDIVPDGIRPQLAWEMLCTDRELGVLVVGFGDDVPAPEYFDLQTVVVYQVQRDREFEDRCIEVAKDFWFRHCVPEVPPPTKPLGKKRKKAS